MAFSPDGRMLACGSNRDTMVWEVATRKLRVKLAGKGDWNWSARFSPDGRVLARLTRADTVEVWDVLSGRQVATFQGHESHVRGFAFTNDGRHLVTASDDCTVLAWDVAGAVAAARAGQKSSAPTEEDLGSSWKDLSSADAQKAFAAIRILADAPKRTTELLRTLLKAPAPLDAGKVRRLLADLGNDTFAVRQRASQELKALGERVEMPIRQFLAGKPSPEARKRADQLLDAIIRPPTSLERLQQLRAIEVLEKIGSEGAREVLQQLAKGPPEASLTRDATASLRRMETKR
jgi:hypothetical protein